MNLNAPLFRLFSACVLSVFAGLPATVGPSSAMPIAPAEASTLLLIQTVEARFRGEIPSEEHPITGVKRLAKMRRDGRLPDTFVRGNCTYNLAGDPGVAYYAKTCR